MEPSPPLSQVTVNDRGVVRVRDGHVWIYASDVTDEGGAEPGALVNVVGPRGKPLGSAIFSSSSQIRLRFVSREPLRSEEEFMVLVRRRLTEAVAYRSRVVSSSNAYRLVFSEADRLPGLIVDRYNDVYTVQILTQAWEKPARKQAIIDKIRELTHAENIVERVDERIRELEQLPELASSLLLGSKSNTVLTMNGVQFHYDALSGQKTGAFLDQRENYAAAAVYARGQALDICTYHGGFALHLARVCDTVTAVDISREALEVAEQNEKLNAPIGNPVGKPAGKPEIEWIEANAFDLLKDYAAAGRQYDVIVLDPPAFARSRKTLPAAMRGYKEMNLRAMKMLRPGGILVTCSCSFVVGEDDFTAMLTEAAQDAHRSVKLLEKRAQAKDHLILLGVPETHYLKCFICELT